MNKRKTLITMLALVCLLVVGIGFAAVTRSLTITGTVTVTPATFDVQFQSGTGYTVKKTTNEGDTAEVSALALQTLNDSKTVTLTIINKSTDYDAEITMDDLVATKSTTSGADIQDFSVEFSSTDAVDGKITIEPGQTASIVVTATLLKAQTEDETFGYTVTFNATAVPV